jgi:hypothetical protein
MKLLRTNSIDLKCKSTTGAFFPSVNQGSQHFFTPSSIQPKLKVGTPDDKYERQADRVADTVMSSPAPQIQQYPIGEGNKLQMKSETGQTGGYVSSEMPQKIQNTEGGNHLPASVNSEMSQKIGVDFSDVNIHTGQKAARLNQSLGARAFTHGRDLFFNSGEYNPESREGKRLLAHELTHVVQQKSFPMIQKQDEEVPSPDAEDDSFEFNYELLPPELQFTIGNWMLEANTGSTELQFTQGLFEYSFGYGYGSEIFAGINSPGLNTRLGVDPGSGATSLGFTIMDQYRLRGTLNPMERSGGVSLGYGSSLLPMPMDLRESVMGGWSGATSIYSGLGSMSDPLSFYQAHSNDYSAVMNAVKQVQSVTDEDNEGFGAGLTFKYNPNTGVLIHAGMQWIF